MKIICILPTGDWAEINRDNRYRIAIVSNEELIALGNGEKTIEEVIEEIGDGIGVEIINN